MAKNLVTGGFGFIGLCLVRQLLDDGEEVMVFTRRRMPPPDAEDIKDRVKVIKGDMSNSIHVLEAVKENEIETIYHVAALLVKDCEVSPAEGFRTNVTGTLNILEAARLSSVTDILYVSTGMVYGATPPREISDDTPYQPTLMYATTKVCCERLGEYYHRRYGLNFRAIRFPMVIGPGREISHYYGDYSGAVEMPARGKPYTIHVDPSNPASLIYFKDVARALIALKRADADRLRQRVYNVQGFNATMREVADAVKKYLPEAQIEFDWDQSEEMKLANSSVYYELDNKAANEDFGWKTRYPLDKMTEDFIKEVKAGQEEPGYSKTIRKEED